MPVTLSIRIEADGTAKVAGDFKRLGDEAEKSGRRMRSAFERNMAKGGFGISGIQAALAGTGMVAGAKRILDWKDALGKMQAEAQLSTTAISDIEVEVLALSTASGKTKEEIFGALRVFQDFGGILDQGRASMTGLLDVAHATGAPMEDLATIASTMITTLGLAPDQVTEAFGKMKNMGKVGRLTLSQIAADLPQLLGMGKGLGFTGMRGVQQMGAAQQVTAELLPSSAESRTAVQGMFRNLIASNAKLKGRFKIDVFDKKGAMKDIDALMLEIMRATKGDLRVLGGKKGIFNDEGLKAASAFLSNYDKTTKNWKSGSALTSIFGAGKAGGGAEAIKTDAARFTKGIAAQSEEVKRFVAEFEKALVVRGGQAIGWFRDDLLRGSATLVGFVATVGIAKAGIAALNESVKLGGVGIGTWVTGGLAALTAGYALGTAFDELTGASDAIADYFFRIANPEEAARRDKERARETLRVMDAPLKKAMDESWTSNAPWRAGPEEPSLAAIKKAGGFGLGGGTDLDEEGYQKRMAEKRKRLELRSDNNEMLEVEVTVKAKEKKGIDKPKAVLDRGASWAPSGAK